MIVCPNCGAENSLGRVFCMNCGGKLELGNMNKESLDELNGGWLARNWKKVVAVVGGVLLLAIFLGLWPSKAPLGAEGSNAEAMWMKSNLNRIERMRAGQYMPLKLTEKRFNGYFSRGRAGEMGLASMSGAMGEDYFSIKAVKQFASFRIKGYGFDIGLSLLVKYGVAEGTASLKSGAIGHIPLPGPLAKLSEVIMVSLIKDSKEHNAAKLMKNAELLSGQLTLRLEK